MTNTGLLECMNSPDLSCSVDIRQHSLSAAKCAISQALILGLGKLTIN